MRQKPKRAFGLAVLRAWKREPPWKPRQREALLGREKAALLLKWLHMCISGLHACSPLLAQDLANSNPRKSGPKKPSVASLKRQGEFCLTTQQPLCEAEIGLATPLLPSKGRFRPSPWGFWQTAGVTLTFGENGRVGFGIPIAVRAKLVLRPHPGWGLCTASVRRFTLQS